MRVNIYADDIIASSKLENNGKNVELVDEFPTVELNIKSCEGCIHLPQRYKYLCTSCTRKALLLDLFEGEING